MEYKRRMIRIGTRSSTLATWQARWVATALQSHGFDTELVFIKTSGDLQTAEPIGNIGSQGVFTREIQRALLQGEVDVAVHSLKDLPTEDVPGLRLVATPVRAAVYDVFVCNRARSLDELPPDSIIGTGSIRRKTQLLHHFGDKFRIKDIRGNVETRLMKLDDGHYDAILLAEAGLARLGLTDRITMRLPLVQFLPAVGQGALGLEIRADDTHTAEIIERLSDMDTFLCTTAERAFLRTMQGGCSAPLAALGQMGVFGQEIEAGVPGLLLRGRRLSPDGTHCENVTVIECRPTLETAAEIGVAAAQKLLSVPSHRIP